MSNYSRLIEIFEKLVSFRTVSGDHKASAKCLDYCEAILVQYGLDVDRFSSNGFLSMVATSRPTKKPMLLLQAHLDVLPAADAMFSLRGEGTKLVGRGTIDMKFAAASYLYMVEELGERCADFDFGIMFTTDEELDGLNGVEYLLDQGFGCDVCFLPDGGNNWKVEGMSNGLWRVKALSSGRSSHASRPWDGINPITNLAEFMLDASKLSENEPEKTTVVPTIFNAGTGPNQIPEIAEGLLDIRFPSADEYERIFAEIDKLAQKHKIRAQSDMKGEALHHDTAHPAFVKWQQIIKEVRGSRAPGYMQSNGGSDARHLVKRGITTLVTRPIGGDLHGPNEWIDEASFYQFYDCMKLYVEAMASAPVEAA